jgi:thermostable 8-oxoguanine DNA glycosylase
MTTLVLDPKNITNYTRDDNELQTFWLFCILVAGKNSDTTNVALTKIINDLAPWDNVFDGIKRIGYEGLKDILHRHRTGQYNRIARAIWQSLGVDLRNCTVNDLTKIHGVGPKTSRFFLLHSREFCDEVVLDTHILKYLREYCGVTDAPLNTPQNLEEYTKYSKICKKFIQKDFPGLSLAQADLLIWSKLSGRLD